MVSCWDLGFKTSVAGEVLSLNPKKIAEWCPRSVILTGFTVNSQSDAEGLFAVAMDRGRFGLNPIGFIAPFERSSSVYILLRSLRSDHPRLMMVEKRTTHSHTH